MAKKGITIVVVILATTIIASLLFYYTFFGPIFKDDFSTLENWEVVNGQWYLEDGMLRGDCMDRGVILLKNDLPDNYEITCNVYVIQSPPPLYAGLPRYEGQIAFRYEGYGEYYFAGLGAYGYKGAIGSLYNFGEDAQLLAFGGSPNYVDIQEGIWYRQRVTVEGDVITLFIDGQEICSIINAQHTDGQVGLTAIYSSVYFDDFMVRQIG